MPWTPTLWFPSASRRASGANIRTYFCGAQVTEGNRELLIGLDVEAGNQLHGTSMQFPGQGLVTGLQAGAGIVEQQLGGGRIIRTESFLSKPERLFEV